MNVELDTGLLDEARQIRKVLFDPAAVAHLASLQEGALYSSLPEQEKAGHLFDLGMVPLELASPRPAR
jgi:hypothetical protein